MCILWLIGKERDLFQAQWIENRLPIYLNAIWKALTLMFSQEMTFHTTHTSFITYKSMVLLAETCPEIHGHTDRYK